MTFGEKLKLLRQSRFLTQQKLADDLGISQSAVGSWEVNFREPDFETVKRIADYFGVPFISLMPYDDDSDMSLVQQVADGFHSNPKLRILFEKVLFMSDDDLDAIIGVASVLSQKHMV